MGRISSEALSVSLKVSSIFKGGLARDLRRDGLIIINDMFDEIRENNRNKIIQDSKEDQKFWEWYKNHWSNSLFDSKKDEMGLGILALRIAFNEGKK